MVDYSNLVAEQFRERFGEYPVIVRSPGRINLIGEHTDYNDGFVLPAAIDRAIYFAITLREDRKIVLVALNLDEVYEGHIDDLTPAGGWRNYFLGVIAQLRRRGCRLTGFNCVFAGDIPIGAGLSSSAALEAGFAFALNELLQLGLDRLELAKLAQQAEHEYAGVQCGIMDQYANLFGVAEAVIQIDCRALTHTVFPINHDLKIVLMHSGVAHELASSEYNQRRLECQQGVAILQKWYPHVTHLRDVNLEMLAKRRVAFEEVIYRRCRYVVEENQRVAQACQALIQRDYLTLGQLLYASHHGLRYDYEVSCPELDFLVETVRPLEGVIGARLMGGGFGGCTINLIQTDAVAAVCEYVQRCYEKQFGIPLKVYITTTSGGTSRVQ